MLHTPARVRDIEILRKLSFDLLRRYVAYRTPRYRVERRMGVWLLLDKTNDVDLSLLCDGVWEADRIAYLRASILEHRQDRRVVFLDIGAGGGLYALVLEKAIGFEGVVAFEPGAARLALLRINVAMNDLAGKVEIVAKAASHKSGYARFFVTHDRDRGQPQFVVREAEPSFLAETVEIDRMFIEKDALVVVKIDVGSRGDDIIAGMKETIDNNAIILQIERNDSDVSRLDRRLGSLGLDRVHSIGQCRYYVKA